MDELHVAYFDENPQVWALKLIGIALPARVYPYLERSIGLHNEKAFRSHLKAEIVQIVHAIEAKIERIQAQERINSDHYQLSLLAGVPTQ